MPINPPAHLPRRKAEEEEQKVSEEEETEASDESVDKELRNNGVYTVWGDIVKGSLKEIQQDITLKHLADWDPNDFLTIMINSDGGDLSETYALIDLIETIPTAVSTVGFGTCASAAAMLLAAGTKGLRVCGPSTHIMIHAYSWASTGKHHELKAHRKPEDDSFNYMLNFWMAHSKYTTKRQVEKHLLKSEDVWLRAEEALAHGIVDKIIPRAKKVLKKNQTAVNDDYTREKY